MIFEALLLHVDAARVFVNDIKIHRPNAEWKVENDRDYSGDAV